MRGVTRTVAQRVVGSTAALIAGLVFVTGCGAAATPILHGLPNAADGSSSSGTTDGTTPSPGASVSPGAGGGGGGTGGTGGGTGGGGSGGGTNAAAKACSLVTSGDASQVLGLSVKNTLDTDSECDYENGENAVLFSVAEEPFDPDSAALFNMLPGVEKINGIGDFAIKLTDDSETQFHVWTKGKHVVLLVVRESGNAAVPGRALLDKVLAKI